MERKIGEIFEYNGEWYQCVKSPDGSCKHCDMNFEGKCPIPIKECTESGRSDKSYVIFKKLEKVGEPFSDEHFELIQKYELKLYGYSTKDKRVCFSDGYNVFIKTKQTKEDMEEKELNLKPFNLEAAKAGKPVCTRDGRNARILAFDLKNNVCPIVAAVEENNMEVLYHYDTKGLNCYKKSKIDLMMLSEKKEGWVNVYKDSVYDTKEEALAGKSEIRGYIDTIKISWEE